MFVTMETAHMNNWNDCDSMFRIECRKKEKIDLTSLKKDFIYFSTMTEFSIFFNFICMKHNFLLLCSKRNFCIMRECAWFQYKF